MALSRVNLNTSPSATLVTLNTSPALKRINEYQNTDKNWENLNNTWEDLL